MKRVFLILLAMVSIASTSIWAQEYVPQALISKLTVEVVRDKATDTKGCQFLGRYGLMELGVESPIDIRIILSVGRKEAIAAIRVTALEMRDGAIDRSTDIRVRAFSISANGTVLIARRPIRARELGNSAYVFKVDPSEAAAILSEHRKGNQILVSFEGGAKDFPSKFTYKPILSPVSDAYLAACLRELSPTAP